MNTKAKGSFINKHLIRYILLLVCLTMFVSSLLAQGNLLIYPRRIVFDGKKSVEKLVLSNTGNDTAVYNISFVEYKMNEKGEMKIISEPEQGMCFASPYVRVFPRKVTLAPKEGQTVKVQLINAQNLTDGEYRSHLYFRAEKNNTPVGQTGKAKDSSIVIKLEPVFGLSIPCIIHKGENMTTVSISNLQFIKANDELQFNLNRIGNMSAYGDFTIQYITSGGQTHEVAKTKGVGVYKPGNLRVMKIKLNKPENVSFTGGNFKVIYSQNESKKVLTEAGLAL